MPVNWKDYPSNWKQIAFKKKESVEWICENCGVQCRKPNEPFITHKLTLTVSHKDHNPMNCAEDNLQALCAPCHLRYDAKHHVETRRKKNEI